jgi:hypothetical protein
VCGLLTVLGCHLSQRTQKDCCPSDGKTCCKTDKPQSATEIQTKPFPQDPKGPKSNTPSKPAAPNLASVPTGQVILLETDPPAQKTPPNLPNYTPSATKLVEKLPAIENGTSRPDKVLSPSPLSAMHAVEEMPAIARPVLHAYEPEPAKTDLHASIATSRPNGDFAHAADYAWLVGKLTYIESRGAWWLRYAPADQPEQYGGAVTLVGDEFTAECKNGQIVRIEGNLVNPASTEPRPPYWVKKIEVLRAAPANGE